MEVLLCILSIQHSAAKLAGAINIVEQPLRIQIDLGHGVTITPRADDWTE